MIRNTSLGLALALAIGAVSSANACNSYRQVSYSYRPVAYITRTVEVAPRVTPVVNVVEVKVPRLVKIMPAKPQVTSGATVTASANFLGSEAGRVFLHIDSATMDCEIVSWSSSEVTFKVPNLGLRDAVAASIELVRPDGQQVRNFAVDLAARPALLEHADGPTLAVAPEALHTASAALTR